MFRDQSLIICAGGICPEIYVLYARVKVWSILVAGSTSRRGLAGHCGARAVAAELHLQELGRAAAALANPWEDPRSVLPSWNPTAVLLDRNQMKSDSLSEKVAIA